MLSGESVFSDAYFEFESSFQGMLTPLITKLIERVSLFAEMNFARQSSASIGAPLMSHTKSTFSSRSDSRLSA